MGRSNPLGPLDDSLNETAVLSFHRRIQALAEEGDTEDGADAGHDDDMIEEELQESGEETDETLSPRRASSGASDGPDTDHRATPTPHGARNYSPWLPPDIRGRSNYGSAPVSARRLAGTSAIGTGGPRNRQHPDRVEDLIGDRDSSDDESSQDGDTGHGHAYSPGIDLSDSDWDEPTRRGRLRAPASPTRSDCSVNGSPLPPAPEEVSDGISVSSEQGCDSEAYDSATSNGSSGEESESDSITGTIVPLAPSLMSFRAKGDAQTHLLVELNDVLWRFLQPCVASVSLPRLGSSGIRKIAQVWDMLVEVFNRVYPLLHDFRAPFHLMDWHCTQGFRLDLPLAFVVKNLTVIAPWTSPLAAGILEVPDTRMRDAVRLAPSHEAGRFSSRDVSSTAIRQAIELLDDAKACDGRSDVTFTSADARRLHAEQMGISMHWMGAGGSVDVWLEADLT